jgi:hypothetical protein
MHLSNLPLLIVSEINVYLPRVTILNNDAENLGLSGTETEKITIFSLFLGGGGIWIFFCLHSNKALLLCFSYLDYGRFNS